MDTPADDTTDIADTANTSPASQVSSQQSSRAPRALALSRASSSAITFGDLLRHYRSEANLTQVALAERAGLSVRGINDLERGARTSPRRDTLRLLADALGLEGEVRAAFAAAARRTARKQFPAAPSAPSDASLMLGSSALPTGTVTFLFTDIERSTQLLQRLGAAYADALTTHQRLLRAAFAAHGGIEVDTAGDGFFVAFPTAPAALAAAAEATRALAAHAWPDGGAVRVRMGLHSGAPQLVGDHYVGLDVHRAARIAAAGHGGQILLSAAAAELVRHELPPDVTLSDLGAYRLKDLRQAERLYQAGLVDLPMDFPALKALDVRPHNLPVQPSPLLGREREVAEVSHLLSREDVRLVTLTGPGGIGKTRLSLQVAAETIDAFPNGVWFVRLSRLTERALVIPTIAQVFDVKEVGATPVSALLYTYLRDRQLLLVLDNFEQVVAAAPQIADLLAACPGVKALVTSRAPLHLQGERDYALRPLALPDPAHLPAVEALAQYAGVALFTERAQAAQADFQVTNQNAQAVAEICARLDGLPLAIELAAARVKLLPPAALLQRLERSLSVLIRGARDADVRQQTMRATLAWSYDLLAPEEQRLFRRLAVFVGDWTLEAAEAVCVAPGGAEPLGLYLLEGISQLLDQSLIQRREMDDGQPRYSLLYVVREFAAEQLEGSREAEALRWAHAAHFMQFVEQIGWRKPFDPESAQWFTLVEHELNNLRAALVWARERGEAEIGLRLAAGTSLFWLLTGRRNEGAQWVSEMLALESLEAPARVQGSQNGRDESKPMTRSREVLAARAWALLYAGSYAMARADWDEAIVRFQDALAAARLSGEAVAAIEAQKFFGAVVLLHGEREQGQTLLEESLVLARQSGQVDAILDVLLDGSYQLATNGALEVATAWAEEGLTLARQRQQRWHEANAHLILALIAVQRGDLPHARTFARVALNAFLALGAASIDAVYALALVAGHAGQGERAARLLGASLAELERGGVVLNQGEQTVAAAALAPARATMSEEQWANALEAGRKLSVEEVVAEVLGEEVEDG